jgi:hypothetical protein
MKKRIIINGKESVLDVPDRHPLAQSDGGQQRVVVGDLEIPFTTVFALVFKVAVASALIGGLAWAVFFLLALALPKP